MKSGKLRLVGSVLAVLAPFLTTPAIRADVTVYSAFKTAYFHQTSPAQPVTTDGSNAYDFAAQVITASPDDVMVDAYFITPGIGGQTLFMFPDPPATFFSYSSGYFSSKSNLDLTFPDDVYTYVIDDGSEQGDLTIPTSEIYPGAIPYFTSNTWASLSNVNPTNSLTLTWNQFVPDISASEGVVFVRVLDPVTFASPFSIFTSSSTTSTNIPAGTLSFGTSYRLEVIFDNRLDTPNAGFGTGDTLVATASLGFDYRTFATLTTILPTLDIQRASPNVILSWPTLATNFLLETTYVLSNSTTWAVVTNTPTTIGSLNVVTNLISTPAQFFRLHKP